MKGFFCRLFLILPLLILISCSAARDDRIQAELPSTFSKDVTYTIPTCEHAFGEWNTILFPTTAADGLKTRRCTKCGLGESENIPRIEISFTPAPPQYAANGNQILDIAIGSSSAESVAVEIVIDKIGKTVTVRGDQLPDGFSKEDLVNTVAGLLEEEQIIIENFPEFEINVELPDEKKQ